MFEEKQKMEKARLDYEERLKVLKEKRSEIVEEAQTEAAEILKNANSLIERTIKEIREEKRPVSEIKQDFYVQKKTIDEAVEKLQVPEPIRELKQFSEGDNVTMEGSATVGTIITVTEDNTHAVVDFNGLKFTVPIEQLSLSKIEKKKSAPTQNFGSFDARATLDLRGMRAEAALKETDVFINEAIINDLEKVSIIHGKGTGILRKVIHEFLKNHPSINSFRLGDMLEGGDGITIVYI
jgi:DNA mismatch repair protein MutS2